MEYNLIDPEDPTRKWVITIQPDGEVTQMKEDPLSDEIPTKI